MQITKVIPQKKNIDEQTTLVVTELVGEHALPIIEFLKDKEKISEFIIAEELNMEINETRNILYKLLEHNLVTFLRKKDRIKGWYICYWDFNPHMVQHLRHKTLSERRDRLFDRLKAEEVGQYFICRNACSRMTFEAAIEQNYKCNECGQIMHEQDNARTKEFLKERITELDDQIKSVAPKRKVAYEMPVAKAAKKPAKKKK